MPLYADGIGVAPFTGAWIEIFDELGDVYRTLVAPFTGAWIEITRLQFLKYNKGVSLPSRERGLKFILKIFTIDIANVAPFTGAWIEMKNKPKRRKMMECRSLHGSVD